MVRGGGGGGGALKAVLIQPARCQQLYSMILAGTLLSHELSLQPCMHATSSDLIVTDIIIRVRGLVFTSAFIKT